MANPTSLPGDLLVAGNVRIDGSLSPLLAPGSVLAQTDLAVFTIPWDVWRIYDNMDALLPDPHPGSGDDLAMESGTFGTDSPYMVSHDFGGTNTTEYARAQIPLPWNYVDGQTVQFRFHAGMLTTVADDAATLDLECFETDEEAGISADICATAAQSINSLTLADIDFTITATSLVAGDLLDIRIKFYGNDAGNLGVMKGIIGAAKLLCDVR